MVAAVRQTLTVPPSGAIEIRADALRPGMRAEVIVLVEAAEQSTGVSSQAILDDLQRHLHLSAPAASEWIECARAERRAFGMRG